MIATIRQIISAYLFDKAERNYAAGLFFTTEYPAGSFGSRKGELLFAYSDIWNQLAEAFEVKE